jgi:hypothetical protein
VENRRPNTDEMPLREFVRMANRGVNQGRYEMKRTMMIGLAAGSAVVAILNATPAHAQQLGYAISAETRVTDDPIALEKQAAQLYESPKHFKRAAALHIKAADLRALDDPMRVKDRTLAARLYYYAGDRARGFELLRQAGDEALAAGDVLVAATTYLDASYVAQELKRGETVLELANKAKLLLSSPLVDARERDRLLSRIVSD